MTEEAILVGAGGFGRELICWAADAHAANRFPKLIGFIDDDEAALSGFQYSLPYLGSVSEYQPRPGVQLLMAIGEPMVKRQTEILLSQRGAHFATLIHPTVVLASSAKIGEGTILCPMSMVSADAHIGRLVTVNALSSVGHDVVLGDFCTLSAHVDITGGVTVGAEVFFGTGAKTVPRINIGNNAKIGAGAVVMRSVAADSTMFSAPARKL